MALARSEHAPSHVDRLHFGLSDYLLHLTLPGLAAACDTLLVFLWLFREELRRMPPLVPVPAEDAKPERQLAAAALTLLGSAYLGFALLGWPLGFVTLGVGSSLTALVAWWLQRPWRGVLGGISWQALSLVAGLLLVVRALDTIGVTTIIAERLTRLETMGPIPALVVMAGLVAMAANVMNNWPAMLLAVSVLAIGQFGAETHGATFGAVLGAAIYAGSLIRDRA